MILEERMQSPIVRSNVLQEAVPATVDLIEKLCMYTCFISNEHKVALNEVAGSMTCGRPANYEDLDVVHGFDFLGSPFLTS
mmetsp:Transcript_9805/g.16671  ORF Transcript_9805/g.16671 Transcript_9805/m.16671 type:complete len:81 (+) Transcript_9805:3-245(+)